MWAADLGALCASLQPREAGLGVSACSWQQVMPKARSHEVPWDGGRDGGEQEQSLSSPSQEQQ